MDDWKIQLNKEINGDLWNFRAESPEDFRDLMKGLAEVSDETLSDFSNALEVIIAKSVQTKESRSYSKSNGGGNGGSRSNSGPPRCKHGEMKDFSDRNYKHRYYCPSSNRKDQCEARD